MARYAESGLVPKDHEDVVDHPTCMPTTTVEHEDMALSTLFCISKLLLLHPRSTLSVLLVGVVG